MAIRPVDFGGMIQRTDDIGTMKHQQDAKPMVDQQNIQYQVNKNEAQMMHQVNHVNQNEQLNNQADARDEGKGQYFSSKVKKKKSNQKQKDGKVVEKTVNGGFDIKI